MGAIKKIISRLRVWFLPQKQAGGCIEDNRTISLGQYTHGDVIKERFELNCVEDIDYITGDCGCTTAYLEGNELVVEIDTSKTVHREGSTPHNKYVTIFYNKNEPYFIGNSMKQRVVNPNKKSAYLMLSFVTVDKESK